MALPPILLIDDDPDDLFILRRLLAKTGIKNKVVAFEDSTAALAYLELQVKGGKPLFIPCAVITDLNMAAKNGFEVAQWIRANPAIDDVRIIMVSDSENPADEQRAAGVGITHFRKKYPTSRVLEELLADLPCIDDETPHQA